MIENLSRSSSSRLTLLGTSVGANKLSKKGPLSEDFSRFECGDAL